jgi:NitT/TauT family transport system ATP-binding protein
MSKEVLIKLFNFSVSYPGSEALNSIDLEVFEGEAYSILGPSGCGKTTFLHSIAGLLPEKAKVTGDLKYSRKLKNSIVFQDYGLFPWKTVEENILLPLKLEDNHSEEIYSYYKSLVKNLKIEDINNKYPDTLSGGQKQRVAVARSWIMKPDLLLLDEPFSSLDALTRESLQDEVLNLYNKKPITTITVTHSIEEAVFMGRHIILLTEKGELKSVVENKSFGSIDTRETKQYYEKCLELRKLMKEL